MIEEYDVDEVHVVVRHGSYRDNMVATVTAPYVHDEVVRTDDPASIFTFDHRIRRTIRHVARRNARHKRFVERKNKSNKWPKWLNRDITAAAVYICLVLVVVAVLGMAKT